MDKYELVQLLEQHLATHSESFLQELEGEIALDGRQVLPKLKGLYRAMISQNKGYWDPKARRSAEDFGTLSPTRLLDVAIKREHRSRFQTWFLQDSAPWPERGEGRKEAAEKLLRLMQKDPRWEGAPRVANAPRADRDRYFDALTALLHCKEETQAGLARRAAGIYAVYRPSIVYPTRYVQGLMACYVDAATGALRTIEVHRMPQEGDDPSGEASQARRLSSPIRTTPELEDILQGCMVQKSRLLQIHAVDLITRSFSLTYLQAVLRGPAFPYPDAADGARQDEARFAALDDERAMGFPASERAGQGGSDDLVSPFALLSGVASGTVGGSFFAYPCVYSRVADLPSKVDRRASSIFAYLRSEPKYVSALSLVETVPPFVLEQLKLRLPPTAQLPDGKRESSGP